MVLDFILYLYMTLKKEGRLVTYLYSVMIKRKLLADVGCALSVCVSTVIWYVFAMLTQKIVWKIDYADKYKRDYNVQNSRCKELLPWTWQPESWKVRHPAAFHCVSWIFKIMQISIKEITMYKTLDARSCYHERDSQNPEMSVTQHLFTAYPGFSKLCR